MYLLSKWSLLMLIMLNFYNYLSNNIPNLPTWNDASLYLMSNRYGKVGSWLTWTLFITSFLTTFIWPKHCTVSLKICVLDLKNLKLTNFFHHFFKANFKKKFPMSRFWICISNHPKQWMVLIPVVYFFFHVRAIF